MGVKSGLKVTQLWVIEKVVRVFVKAVMNGVPASILRGGWSGTEADCHATRRICILFNRIYTALALCISCFRSAPLKSLPVRLLRRSEA